MGFCLLICRLVLIWLDAGFKVPEAGVNPLVCGIRFFGWLAEGPKVSQSWCWSAVGWAQDIGGPGTSAISLWAELVPGPLWMRPHPCGNWGPGVLM